MRVLTWTEEDELLAAAATHLRPIITIALNTGMRRGELCRSEVLDFDFDEQLLTVHQTKSSDPTRVCGIATQLITIVKEWLATLPPEGTWTFPNPARDRSC